MSYVVLGVVFAPDVKAPSAKRIINRMGLIPIRGGGRREDGWLQYYIAEPNTAKHIHEIEFGPKLRLIVGMPK